MKAVDLLRQQTATAWDWLETIVSEVTQEQANWQPGGTANSVGACYGHLVVTADAGFNTQFGGGMPILATEFKGQAGSSIPFDVRGGWADWSAVQFDWAKLREYGRAVREDVMEHLAALTEDDLEKPVDMRAWGLGMWMGLDIFTLHGINHPRMHGGEIACLKGQLGITGYPQASRAFP